MDGAATGAPGVLLQFEIRTEGKGEIGREDKRKGRQDDKRKGRQRKSKVNYGEFQD